jgi:hypothetical protein
MPMKYVHMSTSNNCSKPEMAAVMPTNHSPLQIYRDTTREVSVRVHRCQCNTSKGPAISKVEVKVETR